MDTSTDHHGGCRRFRVRLVLLQLPDSPKTKGERGPEQTSFGHSLQVWAAEAKSYGAVQLAALRKKQALLDIQSQARQAARRDSVTLLQKPVADAEREASEAELRMKELLSLVLPKDANVEVIQELEEAYGKIIIGLQTELASRQEELKQVDNIVEIVKDDIAKSQRQGG